MNFEYQIMTFAFAIGGASAMFILILAGKPLFTFLSDRLIKYFDERKAIRTAAKEQVRESDEPQSQSSDFDLEAETPPMPTIVPFPVSTKAKRERSPAAESADPAPIHYQGRWYDTVCSAAKLLSIPEDEVRRLMSSKGPSGRSLWDPNGHYAVANRHRCLAIPGSNDRLFVSDYVDDNFSRGYVLRSSKRIPLGDRVPLGPSGDAELLSRAMH